MSVLYSLISIILLLQVGANAQAPASCFTSTGCTWGDISSHTSEDLSGATVTFGTETNVAITAPPNLLLGTVIVNGDGNTLIVNATLNVTNDITVAATSALIVNTGAVVHVGGNGDADGNVTVFGSIIGSGNYNQNGATLNLRPGGSSLIFPNTTIGLDATLTGIGTIGTALYVKGIFRIGNGIIRIAGSYNPAPTSTLYFKAFNDTAFTQLIVRSAKLDGAAVCSFVGAYHPVIPTIYPLVTGRGVTGGFSSVIGVGDDVGLWTTQIQTNFASVTWSPTNETEGTTSTGTLTTTTSSASVCSFKAVVGFFLLVIAVVMV